MKAFIVILAVIAVVVKADSSEEILDKVKSKQLKEYLKESGHLNRANEKIDEWCPSSAKKFERALVYLFECDDAVPSSITNCEAVKYHTLNCTAPLVKVVEDCLPQESKSLPLFAIKSVMSAVEYFCRQNGEHIFELMNTCVYDVEEGDSEVQDCGKGLAGKVKALNWSKDKLPTQTQICDIGKDARICLNGQLKAKCPNSKTKEANLGFYDALLAPCNAH